jgi:hypothetical protein
MRHQHDLHPGAARHLVQELGQRRGVGLRQERERLVQEQHLARGRREHDHDQPHDKPGHRGHATALGVHHGRLGHHPAALGPYRSLQRGLPAGLAGNQVERQAVAEDDLQRVRRQRLELRAGAVLRLLADGGEQRGHPGVQRGLLSQPGHLRLGGLPGRRHLLRPPGVAVNLLPGGADQRC